MMDSSTLRQLWTVVEETQTSVLLGLNDRDLLKQLLRQLESKKVMSSEENSTISAYISARTKLIRDIAQARIV